MNDSKGPWIRLRHGGQFHFINPTIEEIDIRDVAWSLAGLPRFNNHTFKPYYVLQHLCLCHDIAAPQNKKETLGHDYAESVMNDVNSPLKSLLPDYKQIEVKVEKVFAKKFKLKFPFPAEVKVIDLTLLATEMRDVLKCGDWKGLPYKPLPEKIIPWDTARCRREFYKRFYKLYPKK